MVLNESVVIRVMGSLPGTSKCSQVYESGVVCANIALRLR